MKMNKYTILLILIGLSFGSCKKDEVITELPQSQNVIYISNEGAFGFGNASLSLYYPDENKLINHAFRNINNRPLGDVLQSTHRHNNRLYLLLNASSKIEVADAITLEELDVIQNISMPRYMVSNDLNGYVSQWGNNGSVAIIDLELNRIMDSIAVGTGPEKMILTDNYLMVCNSGGFGVDSSISVIDIHNNQLIKTLVVGDIPIDILQLQDKTIWVLCKGKIIYDASWQVIGHSPSKLVKISESTLSIEKEVNLFADQHPAQMTFNSLSSNIHVGGGFGFQGIYEFDLSTELLNSVPLSSRSFYGIGSDMNGQLYGFESPSFSAEGKMIRMNSQGNVLEEYQVGIGPNGMSW